MQRIWLPFFSKFVMYQHYQWQCFRNKNRIFVCSKIRDIVFKDHSYEHHGWYFVYVDMCIRKHWLQIKLYKPKQMYRRVVKNNKDIFIVIKIEAFLEQLYVHRHTPQNHLCIKHLLWSAYLMVGPTPEECLNTGWEKVGYYY